LLYHRSFKLDAENQSAIYTLLNKNFVEYSHYD